MKPLQQSSPESVQAQFLRALGYGDESQIIITSNSSGVFTPSVCKGIRSAIRTISLNTAGDVWFTVNHVAPSSGKGRGLAADTVHMPALFSDMDFKRNGMGSKENVELLIERLSAILGTPPAMIVWSGGGAQPYWPIDGRFDLNRATVMLLRWRALIEREAGELGGTVDPVYDLARVLRMPGTFNMKDPANPRPVTVDFNGEASTLTWDEVEELFSNASIPTPSMQAVSDSSPIDSAIVNGWLSGGEICVACGRSLDRWAATSANDLHGSTLRAAGQLLRLGEQGHLGVDTALTKLRQQFMGAALSGGSSGKKRSQFEATQEWRQMFRREIVQRIADTPTSESDRGCCGANAQRDDYMLGALPATVNRVTGEITGPGLDELFESSPELRHIRDAALSRSRSPIGVLGCVLVFVSTAAGTSYVLPPVVGSRGSLNLLTVLAGPSGSGKSSTYSTAEELVPAARTLLHQHPPGSGEGLIQVFVKMEHGEQVMHRTRVVMFADEVRQMLEQSNRSGSTFMSTLRSMATGGFVGNGNADPTRYRYIEKLRYRFGAVIGMQPSVGNGILTSAEIAAGTPQRFLFLDANKPEISVDSRPDWPGPLDWRPIGGDSEDIFADLIAEPDVVEIDYPADIKRFVIEEDARPTRDDHLNTSSHSILMKLKVAAAMAILHGRWGYFTHWDWETAGVIVNASDATLSYCMSAVGEAAVQGAMAVGRMDYVRKDGAQLEEAVQVEKALAAYVRVIEAHSGSHDGCTAKCFNGQRRHRGRRDAALSAGVEEGIIQDVNGRWKLSQGG